MNASDAGLQYGVAAAREVLRWRRFDPDAHSAHEELDEPGKHRLDPLNRGQGYHGAAYGKSQTFVSADFQLDPPPPLGSNEYQLALTEVEEKGAAPGPASKRTQDESEIGYFWAYDGVRGLGTPPRLYNLIARTVIERVKGITGTALTDAEMMELLALFNVAMGDAGILAWRDKFRPGFELWRPVVGIRDNPQAAQWEPLGAPRTNTAGPSFSPPFPAYPSGRATFGAAAFQILRLFFKQRFPNPFSYEVRQADAISFHFVSEELDGKSTGANAIRR